MLFPSVGRYMFKNTKDIIFNNFFLINPMAAVRYSCPIRLVPTYILPIKDESDADQEYVYILYGVENE